MLLFREKVDIKEKSNMELFQVARLRTMIKEMRNDMDDKLSQLKSEIEKEKEARKLLEKEVT